MTCPYFDPKMGHSIRYHTPKRGRILIEVGFFPGQAHLKRYWTFLQSPGRASRWAEDWESLPGPRHTRILRITIKESTSDALRQTDQGRGGLLDTLHPILLPDSYLGRPRPSDYQSLFYPNPTPHNLHPTTPDTSTSNSTTDRPLPGNSALRLLDPRGITGDQDPHPGPSPQTEEHGSPYQGSSPPDVE